MSRSGYCDDLDPWDLIRWRGSVKSAIRGKRGQAFLRELIDALDALPEKRLVGESFATEGGEVCALGAVARARRVTTPWDGWDPDDIYHVGEEAGVFFGIAHSLAAEIMEENDQAFWRDETPERRWERMRAWAQEQLVEVGT